MNASTGLLPEVTATLQRALRQRRLSLWGQEYDVTPALVDEVLGDGGQVIGFGTLDSRPWFWVVRVDSRWNLSNWANDVEDRICEHTDEIYEAIEGDFGRARYEHDCDRDNCQENEDCQCGGDCASHEFNAFPAMNDSTGGCYWFPLSTSNEWTLERGR